MAKKQTEITKVVRPYLIKKNPGVRASFDMPTPCDILTVGITVHRDALTSASHVTLYALELSGPSAMEVRSFFYVGEEEPFSVSATYLGSCADQKGKVWHVWEDNND